MPGLPVNNCWLREVSCRKVEATVYWPSTITMRDTNFGAETAAQRPGAVLDLAAFAAPTELRLVRNPALENLPEGIRIDCLCQPGRSGARAGPAVGLFARRITLA